MRSILSDVILPVLVFSPFFVRSVTGQHKITVKKAGLKNRFSRLLAQVLFDAKLVLNGNYQFSPEVTTNDIKELNPVTGLAGATLVVALTVHPHAPTVPRLFSLIPSIVSNNDRHFRELAITV